MSSTSRCAAQRPGETQAKPHRVLPKLAYVTTRLGRLYYLGCAVHYLTLPGGRKLLRRVEGSPFGTKEEIQKLLKARQTYTCPGQDNQ